MPRLGFSFGGTGAGYFKLWCTNLLLTLLTFGIYSAWARVRNKCYVYERTQLDGFPFEYLASPVRILKQRVALAAVILAAGLLATLVPAAAVFLPVGLLLLLPWLLVRLLAFDAHHSAYRNIRFSFQGTALEAGKVFMGWPLLALISLGVLSPAAICRQQAFLTCNYCYGRRGFVCTATPADYYALSVVVTGIALLGGLAVFLLLPVGLFLGLPAALVVYLLLFGYGALRFDNNRYGAVALGDYRFRVAGGRLDYVPVALANALACTATLGLYLPQARVRAWRYRCDHLSVSGVDDADDFVAAELEQVGQAIDQTEALAAPFNSISGNGP